MYIKPLLNLPYAGLNVFRNLYFQPLKMLIGLVVLTLACDEGDKDKGDHGPFPPEQHHCEGPDCGPDQHQDHGNQNPGTLAIVPTADLQGAFGLLVLENDQSTLTSSEKSENSGSASANNIAVNITSLAKRHNETVKSLKLNAPIFKEAENLSEDANFALLGKDTFDFGQALVQFGLLEGNNDSLPSAMQKIDQDTGEIRDALTQEKPEVVHGPQVDPLPNLSTIAVSPTKEVYLHFERSFVYKDAPPDSNPWQDGSGYLCQVFKVKGGTLDELLVNPPTKGNLECIDNQRFIDSWRANSNGVFQFDAQGNVYYPGSLPGNGKTVVYKKDRNGPGISEVINANICVQDFLITSAGGVFYTGSTCQNGGHGGGGEGGFFRYISPDGRVMEIARDWYDFIFDTSVAADREGSPDRAIFFGPDPRSSSTASWDTACIFNFDPTEELPENRVSNVLTCGSDIWGWIEVRRPVDVEEYGYGYHNNPNNDHNYNPSLDFRKELSRRCQSKDEVFVGGGSQISFIKQDSTGSVYVIGNVRKKVEGRTTCRAEIRGPHCKIAENPRMDLDTQSTCSTAGGEWVDEGRCSDGGSLSSTCLTDRQWLTTGRCSNFRYVTETSCTGSGATWNSGESRCVENGDTGIDAWREDHCIRTWRTETVNYSGATGDICTAEETANRAAWWDWSSSEYAYTTAASVKTNFLVGQLSCSPLEVASSGHDQWTKEFRSLGVVNPEKKSLELLSIEAEKAIDLWLVNDVAYYSSFDTSKGQYLLNKIVPTSVCIDSSKQESTCITSGAAWQNRQCKISTYTDEASCKSAGLNWKPMDTTIIVQDFEAYNIAKGQSAKEVWADGLDFKNNQYKFGTIDLESNELKLKQGLTGSLKTIVILPE